MKLTPPEEFELKCLLDSYRSTPRGTLAGDRAQQDIVRWVNTTLEGREQAWQADLDQALESLG